MGKANRLLLLIAMLLPAVALGQGYDKQRGRVQAQADEKKPVVRFQIKQWALGFGSFFDQEAVTFSTKALYGAVQLHGVEFPALAEGTSTGIAIEGHPAQLLTQSEGDVRFQALNNVDFRVWSINRVPVSAIPINIFQSGTLSRVFSGVDILLYEQGPEDWTGEHDTRMVIGGDLGVLGPGNVVVEIYMFQRDVPIAFSIFYGI